VAARDPRRDRYLPVVRLRGPRTVTYALGRVVEAANQDDPCCPVCGARILVVAFEETTDRHTSVTVVPYDLAPERDPETRFDDCLPSPHAWTCKRDRVEDW
jgi:hypothetical protein